MQILIGVVFATLTGLFPARIPGAKTSGSVAEIFVFLLLLDYGPAAAAIAAAAEAGTISWRTSVRWTSRLGSPAMAALAMHGCGTAFEIARAYLPPEETHIGMLFALLLLMSLAYFAAGTLLMASLIKLKRGEPVLPLQIFRDHGWLAVGYAGSAAMAGLLHTVFGRFEVSVIFAAAPIIAVMLATVHIYFRHAEDQARIRAERVAAAERAAAESARHLDELRESEGRFQSAFTHAAVGMVLVGTDGRIVEANASLAHMLGRAERELAGFNIAHMFHPEDQAALRDEMHRILDGGQTTFATELRCVHSRGFDVWVSLNGSIFTAKAPLSQCLILQLQDITGRRQAEARLQHIAYHDSLTDLANRNYFTEQLTRAIATVRRHRDRRFGVLFLDLDRFKLVNDSLGHSAGDALLIELARRMRGFLRPKDLIARLGGDEFAILVEDISADREVVMLAERLQEMLAEPLYLKGVPVSSSASIGITTSTLAYESHDQVMRDADIAMYRAKAQGKGRYAIFDNALHAEVTAQLWLEGELRHAVSQERLDLVYQPVFDLDTRRVTGFEVLARWTHPEKGPIPPAQFIRVAEETGLIIQLGGWVLDNACRQLGHWAQREPEGRALTMHVNVSGVQLVQPDFPARVQSRDRGSEDRARPVDHRVDRECPDREAGRRAAAPPLPARSRRAGQHRRFRHWIFVVQHAPRIADQRDQDRSLLHRAPRRRRQRAGGRARNTHAGAHAGQDDDRRRHRNRSAAAAPDRDALRKGTGIPAGAPGARRRRRADHPRGGSRPKHRRTGLPTPRLVIARSVSTSCLARTRAACGRRRVKRRGCALRAHSTR